MSTNVRELMLAGAHFGHRVRFWNPKMAPYIYGEYNKTHIINLDVTVQRLRAATAFVRSVAAGGGVILYLSTKTVAQDAIEEHARKTQMPFLNKRWLGGMLTNFKTTRQSVDRLEKLEKQIKDGMLKNLTKKEGIKLMTQKDKLERSIGGVREMKALPEALFIIDAGWHKGAIREANKLGIPVVAVVDTNHSPDNIDYVIPSNDDSRHAIEIYMRVINEAVLDGKREFALRLREDAMDDRVSESAEGDMS